MTLVFQRRGAKSHCWALQRLEAARVSGALCLPRWPAAVWETAVPTLGRQQGRAKGFLPAWTRAHSPVMNPKLWFHSGTLHMLKQQSLSPRNLSRGLYAGTCFLIHKHIHTEGQVLFISTHSQFTMFTFFVGCQYLHRTHLHSFFIPFPPIPLPPPPLGPFPL